MKALFSTPAAPFRWAVRAIACALVLAAPLLSAAQGESASNADLAGFVDPGSSGAQVDKYTGAFSFSLPLMTIPGAAGEAYPVVLGYAPPSPESPASWVGFGWSLGPGAITRSASGIPDDFKGVPIVNIDKKPVYQKLTLDAILGAEILSAVNLGARYGIAADSQRGILPRHGFSASGFGAGIQYMSEAGDGIFSYSVNPMAMVKGITGAISKSTSTPADAESSAEDAKNLQSNQSASMAQLAKFGQRILNPTALNTFSFSPQVFSMPSYSNGVKETRYGGSFSLEYAALPNIGPEAGYEASVTRMTYTPVDEVDAYGFMYSGEVSLSSIESTMAAMDFFEERPHTLDENDRFIPLPIQTPDQFAVSAGNLGGQFRCYFTEPGSFHPRGVDFSSESKDLGVELGIGSGLPTVLNAVVGTTIGRDLTSEVDLRSWMAKDGSTSFSFPTSEDRRFFAFKGDVGLRRPILDDGIALRAVNKENWNHLDVGTYYGRDATKHRELKLTESIADNTDGNWRPELMKLVRWNSAGTMDDPSRRHLQFDKRDYANAPANFVDYSTVPEEALAEFEVLDEGGTRYTFGLPVFERKALNLSFQVDADSHDIINHHVIFCPSPDVSQILKGTDSEVTAGLDGFNLAQGKLVNQSVAKSWLLTSITSTDYIDILDDGCTDDDLGSWVTFDYDQVFGTQNKESTSPWYRFRDPVAGNRFHEGSVGDTWDDMASFSLGEKEVYVLERIETRTHYALFHCSDRTDGASIGDFDLAATARDGSQWGSDRLRRLDKIELYAKNQSGSGGPDELLQTVAFHYAYSSWPATYEEGSVSGSSSGTGGGKLTLTGVTVEDMGVEEDARHFSFGYEYPTADPTASPAVPLLESEHLQEKYDDLFLEYAGLNETPDYHYGTSNAWGTPKDWEDDQWAQHNRWRPGDVDVAFSLAADPAAYCLKQVITPTGARILPQYERNQYRYVQDEPAEIMVPLHPGATSSHDQLYLDTDYLTNPKPTLASDPPGLGWVIEDLNGNGEEDEIADLLDEALTGERVFTKILFNMSSESGSENRSGWNYFPVFVTVTGVGHDTQGVYLAIEETGNYTLPQEACWDFYQKFPRVSVGSESQLDPEDEDQLISDIARVMDDAAALDLLLFGGAFTGSACQEYDPEQSYVRIPLLAGEHKMGGGLRIKRLMVHDPGIESDGEREGELLTGTEYDYASWDDDLGKWVSSGVAANEPKSIYEGCALYEPLEKETQTMKERALGGKDNETQTGPVGESFLPPPAVGYEEVSERSIHDDISGEGETIHRFFSYRSHPVDIQWTNATESQLDILKPDDPLNSLIQIVSMTGLWYSQGVRITTSDRPGKMMETVTYGAERDREGVRVPVSRTTYDYFEPGESVRTMDGWSTGMKDFGVFDEVYFMGKFIRNHKVNLKYEIDMDVSIALSPVAVPVPFAVPSAFPWGSIMTEAQGVHATVMQSHRPSMIRSITTEESGMETVVTNLRFDPRTGSPNLTSVTDGYSDVAFDPEGDDTGLVEFAGRKIEYQQSGLPWYPEMGKASKNDRLSMTTGEGLLNPVAQILCAEETISHGSQSEVLHYLEFCPKPGKSLCGILGEDGLFYPGDLLELTGISPLGYTVPPNFWYVESVDGNRAYIRDARKLSSVVTFDVTTVDVVQSGRSNELGTPLGNILAYDEDLDVNITSNPAAAPFHDLVGYLNAVAIPSIPSGTGKSTQTTNLTSGTWSGVPIAEAQCKEMSDASVGLSAFHMEFHGGSSCGAGYISFPESPTIITTTTTTTVSTPDNQYSTTGVTDGPNGNDPSPNGRVVDLSGQIVIPIHYAPASEGGPGSFRFDPVLGAVVWTSPDAECSPTVVFTACADFSDVVAIPNVMSASASGYTDRLKKPLVSYYGLLLADGHHEFGYAGRWNPQKNLSFNSTTSSYLDGATHSTQAGLMQDFTAASPYHLDHLPDEWILSSRQLELDERGRVIETEDAYGYGHAMRYNQSENRPIWTADGARQSTCSFESFESMKLSGSMGPVLTDSGVPTSQMRGFRSTNVTHSGNYSWRYSLASPCARSILKDITLDDKTMEQGVRVRFWAHEPINSAGTKKHKMAGLFEVGLHSTKPSTPNCSSPSTLDLTVEADSLAQTGKWVLIEARFSPEDLQSTFSADQLLHPIIQCNRGSGANLIYIDDVRVQPMQAAMTCAVFDPHDFRLLTEFDGNHFGTFHQYNHKGALIRSQVETEAGLKTVSEMQDLILED